jgi:hypothetical protein
MKTQKHSLKGFKNASKKIKKQKYTRKRGGVRTSAQLAVAEQKRIANMAKEAAKRQIINAKARQKKIDAQKVLNNVNKNVVDNSKEINTGNIKAIKEPAKTIAVITAPVTVNTPDDFVDVDSQQGFLRFLFGDKTKSEKKQEKEDKHQLDHDDPPGNDHPGNEPAKPRLPAMVMVKAAVGKVFEVVNDAAKKMVNKNVVDNSKKINTDKIKAITDPAKNIAVETAIDTLNTPDDFVDVDDSQGFLRFLFGDKTKSEKKKDKEGKQQLDQDDPLVDNLLQKPLAKKDDDTKDDSGPAIKDEDEDDDDEDEEFWDDLVKNPDNLQAKLDVNNKAMVARQAAAAAKILQKQREEIESIRKKRAAYREVNNNADALANKIKNDAKKEAKNIVDAAKKQRIIDIQEAKQQKDKKKLEHVQAKANKGIEHAKILAAELIANANNDAADIKNAAHESQSRSSYGNSEPSVKALSAKRSSSVKRRSSVKPLSVKPLSVKRQLSVKQPFTPNSFPLLKPKEASFSYRPNSHDLLLNLKPKT